MQIYLTEFKFFALLIRGDGKILYLHIYIYILLSCQTIRWFLLLVLGCLLRWSWRVCRA